jgi:hypothetical protein
MRRVNMFEVKKINKTISSDVQFPKVIAKSSRYYFINGAYFMFTGAGEAKCDKGDKFNQDFGRELAKARAHIDMLKTYEDYLIGLTKQPEWRKEKKLTLRELTDMERDALDNLHKISNLINEFED